MKSQARVVVVGGGIVGASTAYHLSKLGWHDVVVLDMGPLFKNLGSTSHAPGLIFQHNNSKAACTLAQWTVQTYLDAEREANLGRTVFQTGSLEIAYSQARYTELKRKIGNSYAWGLDAHLIGPQEVQKLVPIMKVEDLYGALYVPSDCDVRGVKVVETLASLAKAGGAEFYPNTPVTSFERRNGHISAVLTDAGRIEAEHIVIAAGLWGPVVGQMLGINLPMTPVQHLYVKTAPLAELAHETEEVTHPIIRDQDRDMYYRQHGQGYGYGSYAHEPMIVLAHELRKDERPALYPASEEQVEESHRYAVERIPAIGKVGTVETFNGCFSFSTDGNTLFGVHPSARNVIFAEGVWVTHAGGTAQAVANLLVHGEPGLDLRELDINRFQPHAGGQKYLKARAERQYIEVYDIIHPLQSMEAPRPLRTAPYHQRLKELGAMFVEGGGWERPLWFSTNEKLLYNSPIDWPVRSGWAARYWSPIIGAEHLAVRERVGLFDLSNFFKIEVSGPGALAFLQKMTANNVDTAIGRSTYTAMLTNAGGIKCDLTVTRLAEDKFWVLTGGGTGPMDMAWLRLNAPSDGSVHIENVSSAWTTVGLWGPRAREVVQSTSHNDWSNAAFPYMQWREMFVGHVPVSALRVSYAGELGWEIYTPTEYGLALWDTLWEAGQPLGLVAAGAGAFDSLRLEKGYRAWGSDIHTDYNPYEAGLGFAVRLKKPAEFLGKAALEKAKAAGPQRKLVAMVFDDPNVAIMGKEPIFAPGTQAVLGYVSSANYGYSVRQSFAYGYVPATHATEGTKVEIYYFGERHSATVTKEPLFDPENTRLKA
ncbi:MAG: FAD-dependent oxidoreductase [Anaerolineales bacterium]|nr:FAD-dependent oxidoreductase [Anaerolineales bacterium]